MAEQDNPAGRLCDVFDKAWSLKDVKAGPGWAEIFGGAWTNDVRPIARGAVDLWDLTLEWQRQIEALGRDDTALLLRYQPNVHDCLTRFTNLAPLGMGDFMDPMNEAAMYSLRLSSAVLHSSSPGSSLSEEARTEIEDRLGALVSEVQATDDLPESLRAWVLLHLAEIDAELRRYWITGAVGLQRAVNELAGGLVTQPKGHQLAVSKIGHAVVGFIAAASMLLQDGAAIKELGSAPPPSPLVVVEHINPIITEVYEGTVTLQRPPLELPPGPSAVEPPESVGTG